MADNRTTTFYVIAYDISSDKRRTKVHRILSGFGQWTQFSLFECYLTEKEYLRLRSLLDRHLEEKQDRFASILCVSPVKKASRPSAVHCRRNRRCF